MAVNEPIDPRVRLAISQWPDDAPRGAVSTFCAEHDISRKSFYELRKRARDEGPAAVLEPRSRRPRTSPSTVSEDIKRQALAVRAALESSGLDHGPISVHDKMKAMGLDPVPSVASLARIFRQAGVLDGVHYRVSGQHGFQHVLLIADGGHLTIADLDGEVLIEHTRPAPGVKYVGNGRPPGMRPKPPQVVPKS